MNKKTQTFYERDDVLVIVTTARTGLGHTRVTAALLAGLPEIANKEVLGLSDFKLKALHRIASINPQLRFISEYIQNSPLLEKQFAAAYRWHLHRDTKKIQKQLIKIISNYRPVPKHVLLVCSHFSLAHQLGKIMPGLRSHLQSQVSLSVVVTDDSPQPIWFVQNSDYTFVPSPYTKEKLLEYGSTFPGKMPEFVINPYPVSKKMAVEMKEEEWKLRLKQLTPNTEEPLRVMIPISGAAVQLKYFQDLIQTLEPLLPVKFLVVSRRSKHTQPFLDWCSQRPAVEVTAYERDLDVVAAYERMYKREIIGVEITKPSEQSFKCLYTPRMYGGSVLLFSDPVGRQEDDNVAFMRRYGLLPSAEESMLLHEKLKDCEVGKDGLACKWRGVMLAPLDGALAAQEIAEWHKKGVLLAMTKYQHPPESDVISPDGVDRIWKFLAKESV